jgi:hypothetical protein
MSYCGPNYTRLAARRRAWRGTWGKRRHSFRNGMTGILDKLSPMSPLPGQPSAWPLTYNHLDLVRLPHDTHRSLAEQRVTVHGGMLQKVTTCTCWCVRQADSALHAGSNLLATLLHDSGVCWHPNTHPNEHTFPDKVPSTLTSPAHLIPMPIWSIIEE